MDQTGRMNITPEGSVLADAITGPFDVVAYNEYSAVREFDFPQLTRHLIGLINDTPSYSPHASHSMATSPRGTIVDPHV